VTVGHNCILHGCTIKDDILIGMGSLIMDNAVVESGAFVGAATLVTGQKVVPGNTYVMGNPMRVVRSTGEREKTWIAYAWSHYVENAARYKAEGL
jgi:carbonic anhydrase/acetyltransferase-like protein (isoleucine patch superfamily)